MARELADVIHYFLDDAGEQRAAPPLLALPIGEKEPLRLAFVWNLAVELARRGVRPSLLVPEASSLRDLLPAPAVGGVLAPELVLCGSRTLPDFQRDIARAARPGRPDALRLGIVPCEWVEDAAAAKAAADLFRWTLLFAAADPTDLEAVGDLASRLSDAVPGGVLGATIHGVESVAEAKAAFEQLAGPFEAKKGRPLRSYGLLLDDLLVYRGVVERRPVVLSHPQSLAARALADLAGLVLADARDPRDPSVSGLRRIAPPPRARLLAGLGALLPSLPEPLYLVAEQMVGLEGEIDAVARDGRGRAVAIRVAERGEDLAAFTDLLAQRDWLEPRLRDWLKLSPGLGLRPELGVAALLLAGEFDPRTVAAARSVREGELRLARLLAFDWQGTLQLVIELEAAGSLRAEPAPLRDLDPPRPTENGNGNGNGNPHRSDVRAPDDDSLRSALLALGPETAALESRFRTGLSDEELGLPRRPKSAPR